ncbi:uncharacterized protein LOC144557343 isoform X2 [Carex rostrata]
MFRRSDSAQVLCDILSHNFAEWNSNAIVWDALAHSYAKSKLVHDSLYILSKMDSLNVPISISTYDSLLYAVKQTDLALYLFQDMKSRGISPSGHSYEILIQSLCKQNKPLDAMSLLHEARDRDKFNPCIITFNALTSVLCNARFVTTAKSLWSLIFKYGLTPNRYSYSTLIHGLCKTGLMMEAMDLSETMKREGVELDIVTYNALIHGFCLIGISSEAQKVVQMMESQGVQPDIVTYTILMLSECEKGKLKEGLRLKQEILYRGLQLNVVTYSVLLNALSKRGYFQEVDILLREMESIGLKLDVVAYSILVKGYCEQGEIEKALEVCKDMSMKNCMPNSFTHCSIIRGLTKNHMMIEARWCLDLATKLEVRDIILYNIVIDGYAKIGDVDSAVCLYNQAVNSGLKPTIVTINSLIYGFCKVGNLGLAEKILNLSWLRPTIVTYTILLDAFCNCDVNKMLSLYNEMLTNSIRPNKIIISVLCKGLCKEGRFEEALGMLFKRQSEGMIFDDMTYNILIHGFCKKRHWEEAFKVYKLMLSVRIRPTPVTYNLLINALCLCGEVCHAEMLLNFLVERGVKLRKFAYMTIIRAFCANEKPIKSLILFEKMLGCGYKCSISDFCSGINRMCKRGFVNEALTLFKTMLGVGISPDEELFAVLCDALRRERDWVSLIMLQPLILKSGSS